MCWDRVIDAETARPKVRAALLSEKTEEVSAKQSDIPEESHPFIPEEVAVEASA